jgi:hypothetical protein
MLNIIHLNKTIREYIMYVNLKIDTIDVIYIYNKKYTVKVYEISK